MQESFLHRDLELHFYHVAFAAIITLATFFLVLILLPANDAEAQSLPEETLFSEVVLPV